MSIVANTTVQSRNSLIRSIVVGGLVVGILHLIDVFVFYGLAGVSPLVDLQYNASGALGNAAFTMGLASALLGLVLHFGVSFVVAGVFILSATRLPLLRRYAILGGLVYGAAVYVVMNFGVLPLSAAPPLDKTMPIIIEGLIGHALLVGLPPAIIVRRSAEVNP